MKIMTTPRELMDKGLWDQFCLIRGWNVWCVNEGRCPSDESIVLTADESHELGLALIPRDPRPNHGRAAIPFGRYEGQTIDQVASGDKGLEYLDWMLSIEGLREPFATSLKAYMANPTVQLELDRILENRD